MYVYVNIYFILYGLVFISILTCKKAVNRKNNSNKQKKSKRSCSRCADDSNDFDGNNKPTNNTVTVSKYEGKRRGNNMPHPLLYWMDVYFGMKKLFLYYLLLLLSSPPPLHTLLFPPPSTYLIRVPISGLWRRGRFLVFMLCSI